MAEDKKGFLMYADQREHFDQLSDEEAGRLVKHLFSYENDEDPEPVDVVTKLSFTSIKSQLKRDLVKYEVKKEQWSNAGKASAEARKLKKEQASTESTNVNDRSNRSTESTVNVNDNGNVSDNVNDTVTDNDIVKEEKKETPKKEYGKPEINEVVNYLTEKLGVTLDGSVKTNRQFANHLINKIKKDYPDKNAVDNIKILIDKGLKDKFHGKNITGFQYLYNNLNKIINSIKNDKSKSPTSADQQAYTKQRRDADRQIHGETDG
jgi:hypothetical protein